MTVPRQDTGINQRPNPMLSGEGTVGLCCHLEGTGHTAANQDRPRGPSTSPSFPFQPLQEPHCSSSSQEMGLEKTSLSNQRS